MRPIGECLESTLMIVVSLMILGVRLFAIASVTRFHATFWGVGTFLRLFLVEPLTRTTRVYSALTVIYR